MKGNDYNKWHKYKVSCAYLVLDAWPHIFKRFPGVFGYHFALAYIDYCKLVSDWYEFVFSDNQLIACIFCRIPFKYKPLRKLRFYLVSCIYLVKWIFGYFGRNGSFKGFLKANSLKSKILFKDVSKKSYEITLFLVHSNYRNRGLGKNLLNNFSEMAKEQGYNELILTCDALSNYRFYEKKGFIRTFSSFDPVSSFLDMEKHDIFVYKKKI